MNARSVFSFLGQLCLLIIINELSYLIVDLLSFPIPGNVFGMILLFLLLLTGVIQLRWIEKATSFLLKHLVFFFIPITVAIMTLSSIFKSDGFAIILILITSGAFGMVITSYVAQYFFHKKDVS